MAEIPPLTLLDAGLRGTLVAVLLLMAAVWCRDRPRLAAARAGVALCLGLCVQVLSAAPAFEASVPPLWQAPLVAVSVANAVLFWVFVQALFDDSFRLRPVHAAAWLGVALLAAFNCACGLGGWSAAAAWAPVTQGLQRAVPLVFAVLAAMAAAAQWRADLVEGRRRVRAYIVATGVLYTLAMLVVRLASPRGRLSETAASIDALLLLGIVLPAAWRVLGVRGTDLFPSDLPPATVRKVAPPLAAEVAADPAEDRLHQALQRLMHQDHAYRSEDLSLGSPAARLAVPEYRLRRLINLRLGHRNFNAYVNGLRLEEACRALADPAQRHLPVLSIAMEAGFQSIGPFNRAFKAVTGLTPTEFRKEKLADF